MSMVLQASVLYAIVVGLPVGIAATVVLLMRFRARVARSMSETAGEESARLTAGANMEISAPRLPAEALYKGALVVDLVCPDRRLLVTQPRRVRPLQRSGRRGASRLFMPWQRVSWC